MISDPHQTKYLSIDNATVPIWIYGDEKKPLIYFIHGYFRGFSDYIGDLPMRYLMKNYAIMAFDLPGFGYLKEFEKDRVTFIAEVIENTSKGRRFVLLGTSYGALLSLKYADKYPDRVKGIIIAGMPYLTGVRKIANITRLPIFNKLKIAEIVKEFGFLSKENLSKIKFPILLLYSSKDRQASAKMGKKLNKLIPNSELFTISKYNHGWLMHRIDESGFLRKIEIFLKSVK